MIAAVNDTASISSSNRNTESDNDGHIVHFELSLQYRDVSEYMRPLFREIGYNGDVWFSGSIDKRAGRVLSSNIGRMD